ncbi:MAG: tripartite tricarboxylate transporter substrate binding protein, partial [Alphaproteobacteria bacterium]|nr:tripartite tricarboxylate transporter substrate binding protein [Alphaproteobacteria bacterium]
MRRSLIALVCLLALAGAARADDYPAGPVRILVPFAAGGPTDVVARILAELLSARWDGKPVIVENRPGAGTIVMTSAVAKAQADGLTLGMATNSLLINPAIEMKLPYDTFHD